MNNENLRRLAIARHLYRVATEQSHASDSLGALSILPLHDASEIFLQLACEAKGASLPKNADFENYWPALRDVGVDLEKHRVAMRRLNKVRVGLKHSGVLPDRAEVRGMVTAVEIFLAESCRLAFDIDFHTVSRVFLVKDSSRRHLLELAEQALIKADFADTLAYSMKAFLQAIAYAGSSSPYDPRERVSSINFFNFGGFEPDNRKFGRALSELSEVFGEAIMVVGYQLDFGGYRLLRTHAPVIHQIYRGEPIVEWIKPVTKDRGVVESCLEFAIESCLRLDV